MKNATSATLPSVNEGDDVNPNFSIVHQNDMFKHVFIPLHEEGNLPSRFLVAAIMEYVRTLSYYRIALRPHLQIAIVQIMVRNNMFHLLQEYIQYRVISDSVQMAMHLLALSDEFPPAYQLCLDMLSRLRAYDHFVEILLNRKELSLALQMMYRYGVFSIPARRVMEVAVSLNDQLLFFNAFEVMTRLNSINPARKGRASFDVQDNCEEFVQLFRQWFGEEQQSNQQDQHAAVAVVV